MGSHKLQGVKDWGFDDLLLVPTHMTEHTQRYQDINDYVNNPATPVRTLVSHSLGSAVSSQYIVNHPGLNVRGRLYNQPSINIFGQDDPRIESYSDVFDPVSSLDFAASGRFSHVAMPHSYHGGFDL